MSKINFPKKQEQRLIPKYLLEYSEELQKNHPDPSASWGGGSGGDYTAGEGIVIENNEISVDTETIPTVAELSTVAFSGSYSDLSNKPDLSVYELKEDAFTGDYNDLTNKPDLSIYETKAEAFSGDYDDLTNKPDLSVYELKSEAFSGNYNDLSNKPTIPTDTLDLTNGAGYITGINSTDVINALGYTPGTSNFSGNYNDLTNKPTIPPAVSGTNDGTNWTTITIGNTTKNIPAGGGSSYTAGTGINITNDVISVDNTVALKSELFSGNYNDLTNKPDLTVYELKTDAFSGDYNDLTNKPTLFSGDYDDLTDKPDLTVYELKADAFSGDYNDLTNKPTIPDTSNLVTRDTAQNVTGEKTFVGEKRIKFKQSLDTDKLGFTCYNRNNQEKAYLEYNPTDDGLYLGRYGTYRVNELGFKTSISGGASHKLLVPNVTLSGNVTDYIPVSVNNTKADSSGNISLTIPTVTANGSGTATDTLTKLEVNGTIYDVPSGGQGTTVIANPTLVGTEADLTGLQVGNVKYKVPSGGSGGGGTANLFLHNFKLALQYSSSVTIYLEASLVTKSSTQILTVSELISQIAGLQSTAYNDTVIGVLYGQHYKSNATSNKQNILGFGLTGSAANPNLYLVVPGGNQTSTLNFWSTSSITKTINWVNNVQNAISHEITESCSDLVTPAII